MSPPTRYFSWNANSTTTGTMPKDSVGPLTLLPPGLELSRLGHEAVALGVVELALADAETRLLSAPGYPG